MMQSILGEDNYSALDLKELGDRFSTSMMFGKLANIGDDIADDFLQGSQVSIFKKVVTGNRIKAERKGQDPFEFDPYIKLLFSANDIPRMKDKSGAVLRRLVIIPFNAQFSKDAPDYDPFIKYKLIEQSSIEYLIALGVEGLKRVLHNREFTRSEKVDRQVQEYNEENNPIEAFLKEYDIRDIVNQSTTDVYKMYSVFCNENNMLPMQKIVFNRQLNKRLGLEVAVKRISKKSVRVFVRKEEET
jgi:putative DNA primase/helicase